MHPRSTCLLLALVSLAAAWTPTPGFASVSATDADDVCLPIDDPCVIDEEVLVQPGSFLDFGRRTLRIVEGGILDFGSKAATVRCGKLEVEVNEETVAIRTSNSIPASPWWQEVQRLEAVRECSVTPRACFTESDCDLGECDVRRCELEPSWGGCSGDSDCDLGPCTDQGMCGYSPRRCETNADCLAGPCGAKLTCRGPSPAATYPAAEPPLECTSNADCELGDCSVGDGTIALGGSTELGLADPHLFQLRAASGIVLGGSIEITGKGGYVDVISHLGNVEVGGAVRSLSERGIVYHMTSAGDVTLDAPIETSGTDSGGEIVIRADGDVLVRDDLLAHTIGRREQGGRVIAISRGEIRVEGSTESDPLLIHGGFVAEHSPGISDGSGGTVVLDAIGNLTVGSEVLLRVDGDFSILGLSSAQDLDFGGTIAATTFGGTTVGTSAVLTAARDVLVRSGASVEVVAEENAPRASLRVSGHRSAEIDGELRLRGLAAQHSGYDGVSVEGCSVRIGASADVVNSAQDSLNTLIARGSLTFEEGATWMCEDGPNVARVRTAGIPVTIAGTIDPPLDIQIDATLVRCPNCTADCSLLDEGCLVGTCDEDTATCVAAPIEGSACDDGDECTDADHCTGEICKGVRDIECGDCGNTTIEWGEGCDDGDMEFVFGELCGPSCQSIECGHPTGTSGAFPTARDALYVLRASVGLTDCPLQLCDVNASSGLQTLDALLVLRAAVGLGSLVCPADEG